MVLLDDLVEDILLRLPVEDLTRSKFVCKSWFSLISTPRFAKAHLKHHTNTNKEELGYLRITKPTYWKIPNERSFIYNSWNVIGSCNGLVCLSLLPLAPLILVNNPFTRELRKLPMPPLLPERDIPMSLSFGYDSLTDDYKLLVGTCDPIRDTIDTLFQVFSLKSNTWKLLGVFKYRFCYDRPGILFNGAFHWLGLDYNTTKKQRVIFSFDLSREEFTLINTQPVDFSRYATVETYVGIVEDQLSIFFHLDAGNDLPCDNIWVMRSCKGERYWEKLPENYEMKCQVVHYMKYREFTSSMKTRMSFFCDDDKFLSRAWFTINSPLFVPSLVSPYAGRPSHAKNNKTSVKSWILKGFQGGEGQQLQGSIRRFILEGSEKNIREYEAVYRREVGETENLYFHEEGNRD